MSHLSNSSATVDSGPVMGTTPPVSCREPETKHDVDSEVKADNNYVITKLPEPKEGDIYRADSLFINLVNAALFNLTTKMPDYDPRFLFKSGGDVYLAKSDDTSLNLTFSQKGGKTVIRNRVFGLPSHYTIEPFQGYNHDSIYKPEGILCSILNSLIYNQTTGSTPGKFKRFIFVEGKHVRLGLADDGEFKLKFDTSWGKTVLDEQSKNSPEFLAFLEKIRTEGWVQFEADFDATLQGLNLKNLVREKYVDEFKVFKDFVDKQIRESSTGAEEKKLVETKPEVEAKTLLKSSAKAAHCFVERQEFISRLHCIYHENWEDFEAQIRNTLKALGYDPKVYDKELKTLKAEGKSIRVLFSSLVRRSQESAQSQATGADKKERKATPYEIEYDKYSRKFNTGALAMPFQSDITLLGDDKIRINQRPTHIEKAFDAEEILATRMKNYLGLHTAPAEIKSSRKVIKPYIAGESLHEVVDRGGLTEDLKKQVLQRVIGAVLFYDRDDLGYASNGTLGHNLIVRENGNLVAFEAGMAFVDDKRNGPLTRSVLEHFGKTLEYLLGLEKEKPSHEWVTLADDGVSKQEMKEGYLAEGLLEPGDVSREYVLACIDAFTAQTDTLIRHVKNNTLITEKRKREIINHLNTESCYLLKISKEAKAPADGIASSIDNDKYESHFKTFKDAILKNENQRKLHMPYLRETAKTTHLPGKFEGAQSRVIPAVMENQTSLAFKMAKEAAAVYEGEKGSTRRRFGTKSTLMGEYFKKFKGIEKESVTYVQVHDIILSIFANQIKNKVDPFDMSSLSSRLLVQIYFRAYDNLTDEEKNNKQHKNTLQQQIFAAIHGRGDSKAITIPNKTNGKPAIEVVPAISVAKVRAAKLILKDIDAEKVRDPLLVLKSIKRQNEGKRMGNVQFLKNPGRWLWRFLAGTDGYHKIKAETDKIPDSDTKRSDPKQLLSELVLVLENKAHTAKCEDTKKIYNGYLSLIEAFTISDTDQGHEAKAEEKKPEKDIPTKVDPDDAVTPT